MKKIKEFIPLEFIIDIKNYRDSFMKWMKIREQFVVDSQESKDQLFNQYLSIIKPIIHRFHQSLQYYQYLYNVKNKARLVWVLYDYFKFSSITFTQKLIQYVPINKGPLKSFQLIQKQPQNIATEQFIKSLTEKRYGDIYCIDLKSEPKNDELKWWNNKLDVAQISFISYVIKGKGQGRKSLGMPTANLNVTEEIQKILIPYPNGVYFVDFKFIKGQKYFGAGCLGTNPHYQNLQKKRVIEVYVLHEFDQEFYGAEVQIVLRQIIRFQGKFATFDSFLNAMHNDIKIVEKIKNQNGPN